MKTNNHCFCIFATWLAIALAQCAAAPPQLPRQPAPNLRATSISGEDLELESYRGQVVVVEFWASWCGPCQTTLPQLDRFYQTYSNRGVVVIAISEDEDVAQFRRYLRYLHPTFTVVHDQLRQIANAWSVRSVPTTLVIARDGTVEMRLEEGDSDPIARIETAVNAALARR